MRLSVLRRVTCVVILGLGVHTVAAHAQITVSGLGYLQYAYQLKTDSTLSPVGNANNFDVTRAYITVIDKMADGVTARITADVDGRKAATNQLTYRLKYAYVAWQPDGKGPLTYKMGLIHTPWIDWEESLWDYRFQGTTPFERAGYLSSADFGAGVDGNWNYDQVNMQVGVYDGENYNNAPGDQNKDFEGRVSWRLAKTDMAGRSGGLRLSAFADLGVATGGGTRQRLIGQLAYKSKTVTLAAEVGFMQDSINASHPKQKGQVLAAYGVYNFPKSKFAVIGRLDSFDPNTDSTAMVTGGALAMNNTANVAANKETRFITGLSYTVNANFRFLADVDLNSLENGATNAFDRTRQTFYFHTEFKF
jgi:hypothetical protein